MNMNTRHLSAAIATALLCLAPAAAYSQELDFDEFAETDETSVEPGQETTKKETKESAGVVVSGDVELGGQIVSLEGNSSKFNEYKDDEDNIYLNRLHLGIDDSRNGRYFDFRGTRLTRDDQKMFAEFGQFRDRDDASFTGWRANIDWRETPHLLSNSARTPYDFLGDGTYRVARGIVDAIQISNIDNASSWTAPNAGPGLAGEDLRIASILAGAVHPIALGTQRETGTFGFDLFFSERTKARLEFKLDDKNGNIVTGAPIGDRPPRTINAQLPEPIDYTTSDFKLSLEHYDNRFHIDASYLYSMFENDIESLTWNSLFHAPDFFCAGITACAGATDFDRIRQGTTTAYATTGTIALSPDNTYQSFAVNGGVKLPWNSHLNTSFAYGIMRQDEDLLPFATSDFGGTQTPDALPRAEADAKIDTLMFNAVYSVNPMRRLSLQVHYRYYDLNNKTDQEVWRGNTQDSSSRSFKSERINIAYDLEQENIGADLSYYLGKAGTLKFSYDNEQKTRPQREVVETDEDIYKITYRVRPANWANLMAKYTRAERGGTPYNGEITDQSYGYDPFAQQTQADNPLLGFSNAPGLRKFDVTDRDKDAIDVSLGFVPTQALSVNLSYNYQKQNYDSEILSTINTWDTVTRTFVDAFVDPTQLGLLGDRSRRYALDVGFAPSEDWNLSGFYSREELDIDQRGRFLDENNRLNGVGGTIVAGTKDWQDTTGANIWNAAIDDHTDTVGLDANLTAMEGKLVFAAGFSHSRGVVDIDYSAGANIAEDDTTSRRNFAEWVSPPDVHFKTNAFTFQAHYAITDRLTVGLRYLFEIYRVRDWQQQATSEHQNALSENFVADQDPETAGTSQDRAGSRLVLLDDILAPNYDAHVGLVTLRYRW